MYTVFKKCRNRQGFTLIEGLVSFVLFSLMMALYIPALTLSIQKIKLAQQQTARYALLYQLVQAQSTKHTDSIQADALFLYEKHSGHAVSAVSVTPTDAWITFEQGDPVQLVLEDVH